jgi:hypothetical protein
MFKDVIKPPEWIPLEWQSVPASKSPLGIDCYQHTRKKSYSGGDIITDYAKFHARTAWTAGDTIACINLPSADCHEVWYFEGRHVGDLALACGTGMHNDGAAVEDVAALLESINAKAAMAPYFADPAGFKALFMEPVSAEMAKQIEMEIVEINPEAGEIADGYDVEYSEFIRIGQQIALWWD